MPVGYDIEREIKIASRLSGLPIPSDRPALIEAAPDFFERYQDLPAVRESATNPGALYFPQAGTVVYLDGQLKKLDGPTIIHRPDATPALMAYELTRFLQQRAAPDDPKAFRALAKPMFVRRKYDAWAPEYGQGK